MSGQLLTVLDKRCTASGASTLSLEGAWSLVLSSAENTSLWDTNAQGRSVSSSASTRMSTSPKARRHGGAVRQLRQQCAAAKCVEEEQTASQKTLLPEEVNHDRGFKSRPKHQAKSRPRRQVQSAGASMSDAHRHGGVLLASVSEARQIRPTSSGAASIVATVPVCGQNDKDGDRDGNSTLRRIRTAPTAARLGVATRFLPGNAVKRNGRGHGHDQQRRLQVRARRDASPQRRSASPPQRPMTAPRIDVCETGEAEILLKAHREAASRAWPPNLSAAARGGHPVRSQRSCLMSPCLEVHGDLPGSCVADEGQHLVYPLRPASRQEMAHAP